MTTVCPLREGEDHRDAVHQVVETLSQGGLVALPTESSYVVAAQSLQESAVEKLQTAIVTEKGTSTRPQFTLALKSVAEAEDYISSFGTIAGRLAHRIWPGPMSMVTQPRQSESPTLISALPSTVIETVKWNDGYHITVPSHPFVTEVQRLCSAPLIFGSPVFDEKDTASFSHDAFTKSLNGHITLSIDEQSTRYQQLPTIIDAGENEWSLLQSGIVTETVIRRLAGEVILFVCTGNTCRSPMAEALFRKMLADKLQCPADELMDRGFILCSAGIAAADGYPASEEGVEHLKSLSIDLSSHASRQLTGDLLDQSDIIYTMTQGHRNAILTQRPDLSEKIKLLSPEGKDISDPIGGGMRYYVECANEIQRSLEVLINERNL